MNFDEIIRDLKAKNLYRERVESDNLLNFCSNDYLGLSKDERVIEAGKKYLEKYGAGSTGSALVTGYKLYLKELEEFLAYFKKMESCVVFGSGFLANLGLFSAISDENFLILSDELNHASIIDGIKLSKSKKHIFPHLDFDYLESFLENERKKYKDVFIVLESVFSMDGDYPDIERAIYISNKFDAYLILDEAHATGTMKKGIFDFFNIKPNEKVIIMGTLSKAVGSYGGFVCASKTFIDFLINKARSYIFSTSLPPSVCGSSLESLKIIEKEKEEFYNRIKKVSDHIVSQLKSQTSFQVRYNNTPIIPIFVLDEALAIDIRDKLLKEKIFIQAIRYPTVPIKKARLRLTASLSYKTEDIEKLLFALEKISNNL